MKLNFTKLDCSLKRTTFFSICMAVVKHHDDNFITIKVFSIYEKTGHIAKDGWTSTLC